MPFVSDCLETTALQLLPIDQRIHVEKPLIRGVDLMFVSSATNPPPTDTGLLTNPSTRT